ncbi:MAG: glycosyltransferase family 4 protein [Flavobacteriales bacterium]|nr:glycosyltransferase family 4 protein [Flavobacteriales bacterium]
MISVCHITTVHGTHDDRIFFKMSRSAAAAGMQVFQVAPKAGAIMEDGVQQVGINVPSNRALRATVGAWRAYRAALATKATICHIHDPELLWVAFLLRWKGRKVVYDMHELVSSQILDKQWAGPTWLRKVVAKAYGLLERRAVRKLAAIVLAESRYVDELLPLYPNEQRRFHIIRNLPVLSIIDRPVAPAQRSNKFTIIYVGGLSRIRGVKETIEAVGLVPEAELWLLGWWSDEHYRRECEALPAYAQVNYLGSVRMDEVYAPMRAADLGILCMYAVKNHTTSEPIKVFEYMACNIPMVMSDFPYLKERFSQVAWFADPHDPAQIARTIRAAMANDADRKAKGALGRRLVEEGLCWEQEQGKLLDLYRDLESPVV